MPSSVLSRFPALSSATTMAGTSHPNVSPNKKAMNLKNPINTNVSRNHTESQRDHELGERAPP